MKKCFDCGAEFQPGARFCSQCGRNFRAATGGRRREPQKAASPQGAPPHSESILRAENGGRHREPPKAASPQGDYPYSESIDAWEALKASKRNTAMWIFAVGAVLTVAATAVFGVTAAMVGGVMTLIVIMISMRVSASAYYAIPHSLDAKGEHRCIFCGNRGIWRKGVYRTNNKIANCSKCKAELFYE